jgi:hypothetical protein
MARKTALEKGAERVIALILNNEVTLERMGDSSQMLTWIVDLVKRDDVG